MLWEDPSLPQPEHGPPGAARHAAMTWAGFSDLVFEPNGEPAITTDKLTAYWPWRMIGTNDGPIDPPGFPATDRFIDVPGLAVWRFRGGKLLLNRSVYDRAEMARQLGLMPAPRSRAEQVYVTMAQLRAKVPNR